MTDRASAKLRIAVFSGGTATIHNSEPLVTSNKAREKYGLPLMTDPDGSVSRFDVLRAQRLAAPVTVYVRQFSAHPLEKDAAELYALPDGYLDREGTFRRERRDPGDVPVYEVTLRPEDGLYPLPYMARQASGQPWEEDGAYLLAPASESRQPFYPDASRIFEEIDRLGVSHSGRGNLLSSKATFDFYRAAPPGGYKKGLPEAERTDVGSGDIPPETLGEDFFPYRPAHLRREPTAATLARVTNVVQQAMASGRYDGAIWLEGSPSVEDSMYWLNLLIDTTVPIAGNASQRPHGAIGNDGDRNIVDSLDYIVSRIWADEAGRDRIGGVVVQEERIFTAREVQKGDARPGGYVATGGHGGIVGTIGDPGSPALTFVPARRHTYTSAVNLHQLPSEVMGVQRSDGRAVLVSVRIKDDAGNLLATAIPKVGILKSGHYDTFEHMRPDADMAAVVAQIIGDAPLAGFVGEGLSPYGTCSAPVDVALRRAVLSGIPVAKVGRGNAEGFTPPQGLFIGGTNLTATKARLLLMACLLKLGCLPPAADPDHPTEDELAAIQSKLAEYQAIFDTH